MLRVDIKPHPQHKDLILYALNNHLVQGVHVSHYLPRSCAASLYVRAETFLHSSGIK